MWQDSALQHQKCKFHILRLKMKVRQVIFPQFGRLHISSRYKVVVH